MTEAIPAADTIAFYKASYHVLNLHGIRVLKRVRSEEVSV
jgi:hypothetical protein